MKIGLISITRRSEGAIRPFIGELSLAGISVAERQLDFAISLGCERVICIAQSFERGISSLQRRADAAGVKFNAIAGPRALLGLIGTTDQLLVIAEGLLPDRDIAQEYLAAGDTVLVLPVEAGIAVGFERIDLNHSWAGVVSLQGRLVERLSQLPPDCDAVSALLRIALQGHVAERALPESVLVDRHWVLVGNEGQLAELEAEWLRRHVGSSGIVSPGRTLANALVRSFGPRLLDKGWSGFAIGCAGVGLALAALVVAWFGPAIPAILLCGTAWFIAESGASLALLSRAGLGQSRARSDFGSVAQISIDVLLWAVLSIGLMGGAEDRVFAPFAMLAVLHLASRTIKADWTDLSGDRLLLAVILAIAGWFRELLFAIEVITVIVLVLLLRSAIAEKRITRA